jgi:hypothetical protein
MSTSGIENRRDDVADCNRQHGKRAANAAAQMEQTDTEDEVTRLI